MSIKTIKDEHKDMMETWVLCEDVIEEEVKEKPRDYLPKPAGMPAEKYRLYYSRANFNGSYKRSVELFTGMVFRKNIVIDLPGDLDNFKDNVRGHKESLQDFTQDVMRKNLAIGRHGVLIDLLSGGPNTLPYWSHYEYDSIEFWKLINGDPTKPYLIKLKESYNVSKGKFEEEKKIRYRVLRLDVTVDVAISDQDYFDELESTDELVYFQEIWEEDKENPNADSDGYILKEIIQPSYRGMPIKGFIPFVCFNPSDIGLTVEKPWLLNLANIVLSLFANSADLEYGAYHVAIPTPYFTGDWQQKEIVLGGGALMSQDPSANARFLEFSGAGLKLIIEIMDRKENDIVKTVTRFLENPKKAVEASDTVTSRLSGDESALLSITKTTEKGIKQLIEMTLTIINRKDVDFTFEMNKELLGKAANVQLLDSLFRSNLAGQISDELLAYNIERNGLLPEGETAEDELQRLEGLPLDQE